jgi:3-hydroxyacyl-CoA dehydrogenase
MSFEPIAIIGAGSMGVAWTVVFARAGHPVRIFEPDQDRHPLARAELAAILTELEKRGLVSEAAGTIAARATWHHDMAVAMADAAYCQECAPERAELKTTIFTEAMRHLPPDAILASSSSAIPISHVTSALNTRERTLVVHPLNPPFLLNVVEVVPADYTSPSVTERAIALLNHAGMVPVRVKREIEGFLFNRLQGALLREAYCLVRDGVADVADVDRAISEGLGIRWSIIGPFETVDLNTRGGIRAHAERLGPAYARMGADRGQDDPWTPDLVDRVEGERRAMLPLDEWQSRVSWRDRRMMDLMALHRSGQWRDRT